MGKQLYFFAHWTVISLGFGAGYIKEIRGWDVSISLLFFTFGFRIWKGGDIDESLQEMEKVSSERQ